MKIIKKFTFAALATLVALAAALLSQTSITQADGNKRRDRDLPIPVAIYHTDNNIAPAPGFDVTAVGVVTAIIGTEVLTGTSRMDIKFRGDVSATGDCIFTWVIPGEGTLVVHSVCNNNHGTWSVVSGTGSFKNLKGIGTQTFGPLVGPFARFERFAGIFTHGNDGHGDD